MTPQELKNSILQLAIQGKLVEQRPEEGTAEELYRQIQEEKQKLIKEGKIKQEKPLPEITEDEKPFDIPETWKWVSHNDIFEIVGGSQPPKDHFQNQPFIGGVRLFQIRDYGENPVPIYVKKSEVTKFTEKGDILLARYGASVGKVFWAEKGAYNVALAKVKHLYISNPIDEKYIYYFYLAPIYQFHVKNNSRSAQAGFNKEDLLKLLFPLPPLAEQKRIVAKIEELLPLIDRYEKAWTRLEEFNKRFPDDLQKSLLQMAIQGKLVEQRPEEGTGEELYRKIQKTKEQLLSDGSVYRDKRTKVISETDMPYELPINWFYCRLGGLTKVITKGSSPAWQGISYTDNEKGILFVTSENVGNNEMLLDKKKYVEAKFNLMHPASILSKGDILTNLVGASIGRTAVFNENIENANINQAVCIIRLVDKELTEYILKYLSSDLAKKNMLNDVVETARANLSLTAVSNSLIPLPPLAEQKRIVAKLEELLPLCEKLKS